MGQSLQASFPDEGEAVIDASDVAETGLRGVLVSILSPRAKAIRKPATGTWKSRDRRDGTTCGKCFRATTSMGAARHLI